MLLCRRAALRGGGGLRWALVGTMVVLVMKWNYGRDPFKLQVTLRNLQGQACYLSAWGSGIRY